MTVAPYSLLQMGQMQSVPDAAPSGPEAGLTLTRTLAISTTHTAADFGRDDTSTVLAMDFTGLDGSSGGMLFEFGGTANGVYVGFRANGDFICRAGSGNDPINANTSYMLLAGGSSTITGTGTLVVEFDETSGVETRVWWEAIERGTPVKGAGSVMSGGNDGGIFVVGGGDVAQGEVTTAVPYTTASGLRVYAGQTVA